MRVFNLYFSLIANFYTMKKSLVFLILLVFSVTVKAQNKKINLLIGTYTQNCDSKGIYVYDFDTSNGDFIYKNATDKTVNPSFLTVSSQNNFVYSVNEFGKESTISAFNYNASSGAIQFLNKQSAMGADPCYIINDNKNVIVANYSGGSISVLEKNSDGTLQKAKQVIQHYGKGLNPKRQEAPHVHMVSFSPDKKFILANDMGNDRIYSYSYDPLLKTDVLQIKDSISVTAGSGPRHLTFSKNGKLVYVLQELSGMITVYSYKEGKLVKRDETSILAGGFKGNFTAADIHFSPDGKFLYATNRGDANTISIFEVNTNGTLQLVEHVSTLGKGPRNFAIDPTGAFLLVAHQYSNDVIIFKRNKKTGTLSNTGKKIELCAPVCLVFTDNK